MTTAIVDAYNRGLYAGKTYGPTLGQQLAQTADFIKREYPLTAELDIPQEILRFDRQRLAHPPDPIRFPETRGVVDQVRHERRGFVEASGATEVEVAYFFTWHFYVTRRVQTRYVGIAPPPDECSAVYLAESAEGGPLYGRNWDGGPTGWSRSFLEPPRHSADGSPKMMMKGVSCSVFLDDEPKEVFPVDPFALMPIDCRTVEDAVAFLERYCDFWGPQNCILADADHNSVAIEKANCRMGVRPATDGASAVSALSFQIPDMKVFKEERDRLSIARRGWTIDEALDWKVWRGKDARYERLLELTAGLRPGKATLQDMADVMTDHAVPWPARVCGAGEGDVGEPHERTWTLCSHSEVLEGPNRRMLFYTIEGDNPCYATPPYLVPGEGVAIKPEWRAGTRPLPPEANSPRPRIHMEYPALRVMF